MLENDQLEFYKENGYLLIRNFFDQQLINYINSTIDELIVDSKNYKVSNEKYSFDIKTSSLQRIKTPDQYIKAIAILAKHQKIVNLLDPILGSSIRFDGSKLNLKPPNSSSIEWHQDWAFYPHTNDSLCTVGIMLDNHTYENGCMSVIPKSHKGPVYDHYLNGIFSGGIDLKKTNIQTENSYDLIGQSGDVTIHHVRTIHGSRPNKTNKNRRFLLFQYKAVDAWPLVQSLQSWSSWNNNIIKGCETNSPRMLSIPVKLPLPTRKLNGDIFEVQQQIENRYLIK